MSEISTKSIQDIVVKETIISCIINGLLSLAFFILVFKGQSLIPLGKGAALAFDFLPQSLAVGFFAAFPPMMVLSAQIRKGKILGKTKTLGQAFKTALIYALGSLIIIGGGLCLITQFLASGSLSFAGAAALKIAVGVLITVIITPRAIKSLRS